jgi:arylsulfatase A-like enzyme
MAQHIIASLVILLTMNACSPSGIKSGPVPPHNVLFIALDDMNDWTTLYHADHPIQVPNLQRLAGMGTFFTQAYCNASACNPSRASVLSGVRPSTSGVYGNASDWKTALSGIDLLPAHFRKHGYRAYCAGKIFHHHGPAFQAYEVFDEHLPFPATQPPDSPMPEKNLCGVESWYDEDGNPSGRISPNFDWGAWPADSTLHIDHQTVDWAIDRMQEARDPFLLAVGIFRPHMPFYTPPSFLEAYPMENLVMPLIKPDDFDDLPPGSIDFIQRPSYRWMSTFRHEEQRDPSFFESAVRGYQASCTYADFQLGRLLDAMEAEGLDRNTIIVLWSDHGYHLGEKDHWEKFILYEKTTHVPMIIVVPGLEKGKKIRSPASLIDLYPTLSELCGLPLPGHLEGESLVPLLDGSKASTEKPVITTYGMNNHAIRSEEYRYIRLADGSEELYQTAADPHEWNNLAADTAYRSIINELKAWIPDVNKEPVPNARRESR